jgi:nicotinate-nucleotide adenylyltransferase
MVDSNLRLGIFGGTFDPIHLGHIRIARIALQLASLNRVYFVTSANPPHKSEKTSANFLDRHAMVALALGGQGDLIPSSIEGERPGKSYSIDTLRYFRSYAGERGKLFFIIGLDAFLEITSWKEFERFPSLCSFLIFVRPGFKMAMLDRHPFKDHSWRTLAIEDASRLDESLCNGIFLIRGFSSTISSTEVRLRVRSGRSIKRYVPREVQEYIQKVGLYRSVLNGER